MHSKIRAAVVATFAVTGMAFAVLPADASQVIVVAPGQSIQAAVDAASPGDTVLVRAGTYHENVVISTNDITLEGSGSGPNGTLIEPPATLPDNFCASVPPDFPTEGGGVCVFGDFDQQTGVVHSRVTGDRVTNLAISGFAGDDIGTYATDGLRVDHVAMQNAGVYGIAVVAATNTVVDDNTVSDVVSGQGAAMYVAFAPNAGIAVTRNTMTATSFGVFVQDAGDVALAGNTVTGSCDGMLILDDNHPDDSQPLGAGNIAVTGNTLHANNELCPGNTFSHQPEIKGTGVALVGTTDTAVVGNTVTGNTGTDVLSGGITLQSAVPFGGLDESDVTISGNTATGNGPADLLWDGNGTGVVMARNTCGTSSPSGLC